MYIYSNSGATKEIKIEHYNRLIPKFSYEVQLRLEDSGGSSDWTRMSETAEAEVSVNSEEGVSVTLGAVAWIISGGLNLFM